MYCKKENTLSMLGGAALGAIAMYLLDPENGANRRQRVADTTGDAAHRASEAMGPMWERVSEHAKGFSANMADRASTVAAALSEKLSDAQDATSETAHNLSDTLADKFNHARKQARKAAAVPASWFHHEEPSHVGAYTATGVSTLLVGAGLMYLFDPQRGRTRRAKLIDQISSVVRRTGNTACQMGRDISNRGSRLCA